MTKMFIRTRESMVRNTRGQTMTEYAPDRRLTVPQIGTGSSNSSRSAKGSLSWPPDSCLSCQRQRQAMGRGRYQPGPQRRPRRGCSMSCRLISGFAYESQICLRS